MMEAFPTTVPGGTDTAMDALRMPSELSSSSTTTPSPRLVDVESGPSISNPPKASLDDSSINNNSSKRRGSHSHDNKKSPNTVTTSSSSSSSDPLKGPKYAESFVRDAFAEVCAAMVHFIVELAGAASNACRSWSSSICNEGGVSNKSGISYSPRMYEYTQAARAFFSSKITKLSLSFLGLIGFPLLMYNCIPASTPSGLVQAFVTFWDGCLLMSSRLIFLLCLIVSFYYACTNQDKIYAYDKNKKSTSSSTSSRGSSGHHHHHQHSSHHRHQEDRHMNVEDSSSQQQQPSACSTLRKSPTLVCLLESQALRFHRMSFLVFLFYVLLVGILGPWTLVFPSWLWHPFLWGSYQVYWPSKLAPAMQGLCVDYSLDEGKNGRLPLCLTDESWDTLSTGSLSSTSTADVEAVLQGIAYGKQHSGGIVVSILARDVVDFIAPLRQNVESLVPFFSNVAVVVFENDSKDGSREAFKRWKQVVKGYEVDLIECDDAVDCKFGKIHRDDGNYEDFSTSSAIGDMHRYRQRVVDYVLGKPTYQDYSHMIVLDIDLGVSVSPLGVLHTLGTLPDNPVASVGRQPWPTAFGTLIPPYDFSAFRPYATRKNSRLLELHKAFCNLMPPGDRWRNECDALSPIQMILVLTHDRMNAIFVRVESAFNGAVMYPLKLIRDSDAKYDKGEDGQRCEHIGFHMSLKKPMYMNRKWDMHISPTIPGGPNGQRAQRTASRIFWSPTLQGVIDFVHITTAGIFVWSSMAFGAFFLYPLLFQGDFAGKWNKRIKRRQRKRHPAMVKTV